MKHLFKRFSIWRLLGLVLAVLGFWMFLYPVIGGFVDLSNISGMAACLIFAGVLIFWKPFLALIRWFWRRLWGKILLLLTGLGLLAALVLLIVLTCLVLSGLGTKPDRDCKTVVVLGCQVRGETPSLHLYYRINAAADYLNAHPEAVAILSGGQGPGEDITEAACMRRELMERGISADRLYLEEESSTTRENLLFSKELMAREGLSGPVVIISNSFHMYRALQMAEDLDFPAQGLAAKSRLATLPVYVFREALALIKYGLTK